MKNRIEKKLKESNKNYELAAEGYDKGWYAGASDAYSEILAILDNLQSYNFEELKEGMAYYHSKLNKVCLLVSKKDKDCIILSVCSDDGGSNIVYIEFQKNSFFPVEKANTLF